MAMQLEDMLPLSTFFAASRFWQAELCEFELNSAEPFQVPGFNGCQQPAGRRHSEQPMTT
ncbi:MAG TPA: hypothetical protein V6C97_01085 [Oculatellaceae cyanobacterium]